MRGWALQCRKMLTVIVRVEQINVLNSFTDQKLAIEMTTLSTARINANNSGHFINDFHFQFQLKKLKHS